MSGHAYLIRVGQTVDHVGHIRGMVGYQQAAQLVEVVCRERRAHLLFQGLEL